MKKQDLPKKLEEKLKIQKAADFQNKSAQQEAAKAVRKDFTSKAGQITLSQEQHKPCTKITKERQELERAKITAKRITAKGHYSSNDQSHTKTHGLQSISNTM